MVKYRFDLTIQHKQLRFVKKRLTLILPLNLRVINFLRTIILFQGQGASYNNYNYHVHPVSWQRSNAGTCSKIKVQTATCLSDILLSVYLIFHFIYSSEAPETAAKIVKETPKAYTEFAI